MTKTLAKYLTIILVSELEKAKFVAHDVLDTDKIQSWFEYGQFDKVEELINRIS